MTEHVEGSPSAPSPEKVFAIMNAISELIRNDFADAMPSEVIFAMMQYAGSVAGVCARSPDVIGEILHGSFEVYKRAAEEGIKDNAGAENEA